jgi:3-mercaptopyruvate sulfurtransferase SseA
MNKRKNTGLPLIILVAGGILLILAAAILFKQNRVTPQPSPSPTAVKIQEQGAAAEVQRVSLPDAKAALDDNMAVFVDVRSASAFAESHIPGALSIPLAELENRLDELNPADWIITYCT